MLKKLGLIRNKKQEATEEMEKEVEDIKEELVKEEQDNIEPKREICKHKFIYSVGQTIEEDDPLDTSKVYTREQLVKIYGGTKLSKGQQDGFVWVYGYKATDDNMECRGFQYEIGKEFKHKGYTEVCASGFHFCLEVGHTLNFYPINSRFFKVKALVRLSDVLEYGTFRNIHYITDRIDKLTSSRIVLLEELGYKDLEILIKCAYGQEITEEIWLKNRYISPEDYAVLQFKKQLIELDICNELADIITMDTLKETKTTLYFNDIVKRIKAYKKQGFSMELIIYLINSDIHTGKLI